ncbi:MAG TPA: arylesterase [Kofleriaceae bacterium]|nr:arylesterase [Kofleriaceae bacterium]
MMSDARAVGRAVALAAALSVALLGGCDRDAPPAAKGRAPAAADQPAARSDPGAQADRRPALVFLGDSLTAGFGLAAEESVPALIQGDVDRAGLGLRVINAGRSGDTTAGGKSRVDYYLRREIAPRALVVWLGANDIMRGLPTAEIEANLRAIIQRAHQFDRGLAVFVVQMRAFPNLGADYARAFEDIFPRVAKSEDATLLPFPLADVAGRPELNQADGIHPTAEATRTVADDLWRALRPALAH